MRKCDWRTNGIVIMILIVIHCPGEKSDYDYGANWSESGR